MSGRGVLLKGTSSHELSVGCMERVEINSNDKRRKTKTLNCSPYGQDYQLENLETVPGIVVCQRRRLNVSCSQSTVLATRYHMPMYRYLATFPSTARELT